MDTDIHAMLQDAEDYLNGELLRITEEWPSEREHQGESMLMPYLSYSKEHRYFYRIALANRNMLPEVRPQVAVRNADHHHWKGIVLMAEKCRFTFREYPA